MIDSRRRHIFIVGMAAGDREDLATKLEEREISLEYFDAAGSCHEALLQRCCSLLVIDLQGHTGDGLQLLAGRDSPATSIPVLALVGEGDIRGAIEAIRAGAANCLEKSLENDRLLAEIQALLSQTESDSFDCPQSLTKMEMTVLRLILAGSTTSQIARELHRSPRTIEVHRSHIMHKLRVSNPIELLKTAASMGLLDRKPSWKG